MANTLFTTRAYSTVRRELLSKAHSAIEKADSIWVCCPFHGESTPSLKVNTSEGGAPFGWFYCFGCRRTGPWNELADKLHMQKFDASDLKSIDGFAPQLGRKYARIKKNLIEEVTPQNEISRFDEIVERNTMIPVAVDWRGIAKDTLEFLGCTRVIDTRSGETFLIIPITIDGDPKGLVRARWLPSKEKGTNYFNSKYGSEEHWAKKYGLIGYDAIKKMKAFKKYGIIFIVEGPRDAMRLIQLGIPTVSILGAGSWTASKRNLLLQLEPNLVCSLMDNDKTGRRSGKSIEKTFYRRGRFHRFVLPKDKDVGYKVDPMTLPEEDLQRIWNEARRLAR